MDSYVNNCAATAREGETLFHADGAGNVLARLDGYAIIPKERLGDAQYVANLAKELADSKGQSSA